MVSAFRFTDSPWVKKGTVFWGASSRREGAVRKTIETFETQHAQRGFLEVRRQQDGTFDIIHGGAMFLPVFVIELPLSALITLAMCLANYLAQPTIEQWDGQSSTELVA